MFIGQANSPDLRCSPDQFSLSLSCGFVPVSVLFDTYYPIFRHLLGSNDSNQTGISSFSR
jgi:hypothetical protein